MKYLSLLLLVMTACQSQSPPDFTSIDQKMKEDYSSETSGIALSVVSDSSTIWSGAYGMANIALQQPMTVNDVLNIASVSKVFVATAIMQLSEKGLLTLNDHINMHLPFEVNYPGVEGGPITVHHLLTHRSSIIDGKYYDDSYTTDSLYIPLSEWIENYLHFEGSAYSSSSFSEFDPGQNWSYSNIGFGILALIVENISGLSFESYCQEYIFTPLEMHNTAWKQAENRATSYAYFIEEPENEQKNQLSKLLESQTIKLNAYLPITPYTFPNYPDGLLFSSVQDLGHFAQCILNRGKYKNHQLLSEEVIKQMFEIQGEEEDKQGLCWRFTGFGSIWGHGGDDPGVQTGLYIDRENNRAMIMMKNSNVGGRTKILKDLYQASMRH